MVWAITTPLPQPNSPARETAKSILTGRKENVIFTLAIEIFHLHNNHFQSAKLLRRFTLGFTELMELLIPLHRVRIKQHTSPWAADSEVIAAHCKRDKAHCQALKTGNPLFWQEYRSARNKANKLF